MGQDAPPPAAIRQLLVDAGCRRDFIPVMHNITFSLACMGEAPETVIARWKDIKRGWFCE